MTVVRFPSRLRLDLVDGEDPSEALGCIIDAYEAALDRALGHARTLHLVRDARLAEEPRIELSYTGDSLPDAARQALTRRLSELVAERADGLRARPEPPADRSREDGTPVEPWDLRKLLAALEPADDLYFVPGYSGGGAPVAVPLQGGAGSTGQPARVVSERRLWQFTTWLEAQQRLVEHYHGSPPAQLIGVWLERGRPRGYLVEFSAGVVNGARYLGEWVAYTPPPDAGPARQHALSLAEDADEIVLGRVALTRAQRIEGRVEQLMLNARHLISATLTEAMLRNWALALARQRPDTGRASRFYRLQAHGHTQTLIEVDDAQLPERCPVAVLNEVVRVAPADGDCDAGRDEVVAELPLEQLLFFEPDPDQPFLAEPPVEWWPSTVAARFLNLMQNAARTLGIESGRYPGMFVLYALTRISHAARELGGLVGTGEGDSPRLRRIRTMAGVFDTLDEIQRFYQEVLKLAEEGGRLPRMLRHNVPSWVRHFVQEYHARIDDAVRALFVATCQDILLDVLEESGRQLMARKQNFAAYMQVTRALVQLLLVDEPELSSLRQLLFDQAGQSDPAPAGDPIGAWWSASQLVLGAYRRPAGVDGPPQRGRVRWFDDGPRVQDSAGRWWTRAELDAVLQTGRREALAIDPMLEKIDDLPDAVQRLRSAGPSGIDAEFRSLIDELIALNADKTRDARTDVDLAFGLATIEDAPFSADNTLGARLSGIHAEADEVLRPAFVDRGADVYLDGLRDLAGSELGEQAFFRFFNLVGLVTIAIFCPPAAFAIGAVEALGALHTAVEHRQIQRAMLGGDDIISKAQAEAELWGAAIGVALAFLPEVGTVARGAAGGVRAAVRGELRQATQAAGREIAKRATAHLAELAARDLAMAFARDCLTGYIINEALEAAIGRFTQAIAREVEVSGSARVGDLSRLVGDAVRGTETP